jgi:hypothetical protein
MPIESAGGNRLDQDAWRSAEVLASPGFVTAVALLVVNDWILKATLGNWWTGKLSDFAGLYAFPLFWSAFLPRRQRMIFALTVVAFVVWKSPLSGPPIAAWNALGLWPVSRVVDYTDWIALAALLPSYRSALGRPGSVRRRWVIVVRRAAAAGMAAVAAIAFMATSTSPSYHYDFPPGADYQVDGERAAVRAYFLAHDWESSRANLGVAADTVSGGGVRITLRDASPCGTRVTLVDLESPDADEDLLAVQREFEQEVIEALRVRFPTCTQAVTARSQGNRKRTPATTPAVKWWYFTS